MPGHTILRLAVLLCAVLAPTALAQRTTDLSWQWRSGDHASYTVRETMTQRVDGNASDTLRWERTIEYTERVLSVDPETGEATIERRINRVAVRVAGDAMPAADYDSADPDRRDAASPLVAPFARMNGASITFVVTPEGAVRSVEGAEELWSAALEPMRAGPLGHALGTPDAGALRAQIEAGLRILPNDRVRRGRPWTQQVPNATPLGTLVALLEHELAGTKRSGGRALPEIRSAGTLTMDAEAQPPAGPLGLTGLSLTLDRGTIEGSALYDPEVGRLQTQTLAITTVWRSSATSPELADLLGDATQTIVQTAESTMTKFTRGASDSAATTQLRSTEPPSTEPASTKPSSSEP
jgi:hypothetical protein